MVPTCQKRNESNDCLLETSRPDDQLARPAVTAAPASVRRRGVTPRPARPPWAAAEDGRPVPTRPSPRPPMLPTCQKRNESNDCLLETSRPDDQLARPAVTAAPASVRRRGATPPPARPARAWTSTAARPAPA